MKENSPIAIEIIAKADGIEDNVERLNFLRKALEDTAQAYLVASDAKDILKMRMLLLMIGELMIN